MESFALDDLLSFIKQFVLNGRSKDVTWEVYFKQCGEKDIITPFITR